MLKYITAAVVAIGITSMTLSTQAAVISFDAPEVLKYDCPYDINIYIEPEVGEEIV